MSRVEQPDEFAPPDVFHVAQDDGYRRLVREEEAYWDGCSETPLTRSAPKWVQRYQNERLTGDPGREWFETFEDFGDFERGCVLGAGPGRLEEYLLRRHKRLELTVCDIAEDALARIEARLGNEFGGRLETRHEDLNFVSLPEKSYDLIYSESSIHHLVNLEHVGFQVNRALTRDGYFFLRDNVGESYFQFSPEKRRLYEALLRATRPEEPFFDWPDRERWVYSPFEAVRSGETLEVFRRYLEETELRTCGALLAMNLFVRQGMRNQSRALHHRLARRAGRTVRRALGGLLIGLMGRERFLARTRAQTELLLHLDGIISDSQRFKPGMAFAVYRKRGG